MLCQQAIQLFLKKEKMSLPSRVLNLYFYTTRYVLRHVMNVLALMKQDFSRFQVVKSGSN